MNGLGMVVMVAGSMLAFWPTLAEPFSLPKLFCILIGAALCHLGTASRERAGAPGDFGAAALPAFLWAAALLETSLFSSDRSLSIYGARGSYASAVLPAAATLLALLATARAKPDRNQAHAVVALSAATLALVTCLWECSILYPFSQSQLEQFGGRAFGPMGGPVFLGPMLAVCLPSALLWARPRGAVALTVPCLVVAALVLSGTRAAMASAVLACAYMLVRGGHLRPRVAGVAALPMLAAVAFSRASFITSDTGRLEVWGMAWRAFADRPVFGWGPDTFGIVSRRYITESFNANQNTDLTIPMHAHNLVLQALASCGLAIVPALLVSAAMLAVLHYNSKEEDTGAWAAFAAAFLCSMTNPMPIGAWLVPLALLCTVRCQWNTKALRRPLVSMAMALFCMTISYPITKQIRAEHHALAGMNAWRRGEGLLAAVEFNKAAALAPHNAEHTSHQLDSSRNLVPFLPLLQAQQVVQDGLRIAKRSAAWHPEDPLALQTLSAQYALAALTGDAALHENYINQSHVAMQAANERTPFFTPNKKRLAALVAAKGVN